jgi:hypothetical protein
LILAKATAGSAERRTILSSIAEVGSQIEEVKAEFSEQINPDRGDIAKNEWGGTSAI